MNTHDLIQPLIDLGKYLEDAEEANGFANQEIMFWRKRFLESVQNYDDIEKTAFIHQSFLYTPSQQFLAITPEVYIKLLETHYES